MKKNAITAAATATALTSSAGNVNTPIYFSSGKPVATNNKLGAVSDGSYWGMRGADNGDGWIRTTSSGIIPVQNGNAGSGHCGLGTSTWYFSYLYVDNSYAVHQRSSGRAYMDEWIEFSGTAHGLYCPNGNGAHWYPNNVSTYGTWMMQGSRGGYTGIHLGPNKKYMTIMGGEQHNGLYCEQQGRWIVYYDQVNNRMALCSSSNSGYTCQINGSCYITSGIYGAFYGRLYCSASVNNIGSSWVGARDVALVNADYSDSTSSVAYTLCRLKYSTVTYGIAGERSGQTFGIYGWANGRTENGVDWQFYIASDRYFHCNTRIYNAVWNDFAEYRQGETTQGGRVVYDDGTGIMKVTTERLQPAARIVSDTYGLAVGESDKAKTPIGIGGRVLAYPYRERNQYKVGDAVCAAPNGTIDIMSQEEICKHPDRIIGIVSEIPEYEIWENQFENTKIKIAVNNRIWVYVR